MADVSAGIDFRVVAAVSLNKFLTHEHPIGRRIKHMKQRAIIRHGVSSPEARAVWESTQINH